MKPSRIILCLFVGLMCFVAGCAKQHQEMSGGIRLDVDGTPYWLNRYADVDSSGNVRASFLTLGPLADRNSMQVISEYHSSTGIHTWKIRIKRGDFDPANNELYYIDEHDTVSRIKYGEYGINSNILRNDEETVLKELCPVLEKIIRERLNKKEKLPDSDIPMSRNP